MRVGNTKRNETILLLAGKSSYGVIAHRLGISRQVVAGVVDRAKKQGWQPCQRTPIERLRPDCGHPGEKHPRAILSEEAVKIIRAAERGALAKFAKRFGVNIKTIYAVRGGRTWKHVGTSP